MRWFWHRSDVRRSPLAARSRSRNLPHPTLPLGSSRRGLPLEVALRATPAGSPLAPLDAALGEYHTSALQTDERNRRSWYYLCASEELAPPEPRERPRHRPPALGYLPRSHLPGLFHPIRDEDVDLAWRLGATVGCEDQLLAIRAEHRE